MLVTFLSSLIFMDTVGVCVCVFVCVCVCVCVRVEDKVMLHLNSFHFCNQISDSDEIVCHFETDLFV
jgi:hypothetical protein